MKSNVFSFQSIRAVIYQILLLVLPSASFAQINERLYSTDYRIEPGRQAELSIEIDNLNFFKNNEFAGNVMDGYSLPGLWIQSKAVYYPLTNIKIELGLHALIYHGTYKYPSLAYVDIAQWKGNQFQKGSHLLPYLRAQVDLSDRVTLVFGNIYGGANHRLIDPLYNAELNYTADPETGLQLLYNGKAFEGDLWLNWQSFIFRTDTHQEAFTVGISSRIKFNSPASRLHWYLPVQGMAQHRGGEIDTLTVNSVQTLMNGAAGIGLVWNINHPVFKNINAELDVAGYYQQAGDLWPFDSGHGIYLKGSADIYDFRVKAAYWKSNDFLSMYGLPFYGSLSTKIDGLTFRKPGLIYLGFEYFKDLGKGFSLGVDLDVYQSLAGEMIHPEEGIQDQKSATSFAFGVYLRCNPSFLLKKF